MEAIPYSGFFWSWSDELSFGQVETIMKNYLKLYWMSTKSRLMWGTFLGLEQPQQQMLKCYSTPL